MGRVDSFCDNFMWFPKSVGKPSDVKGETTDEWFSKRYAFEVSDFGFSCDCEESTGKKGDPKGKGKASFNSFTVTKTVDLASVPLYSCCSQGMIVPTVMLAIRRVGGAPLTYLQYIFRYCQIKTLAWKGGAGDRLPEETLTLTFKAMGMQYVPQMPDGSPGVANQWAWNVADQGSCSLDFTGYDPPPTPTFVPAVEVPPNSKLV